MACRWIATLSVVLALAGGCGDDQKPKVDTGDDGEQDSFGMCEPGAELPCQCPDGRSGTQTCQESGFELDRCMCGPADPPTLDPSDPLPEPPTSSSTGTGTDTDAGTGIETDSASGGTNGTGASETR